MKSVWMAGALLALVVPASSQQFSEVSNTAMPQAAALSVENPPREAALERAALDMIHKDYASAAAVYKTLLKETPNDAVLWNRLGVALQQQDMFNEALKSYARAAKLDSKGGDAWNNMGTVYFQEKKWAKSVRTYKKAISLNPQNATFYSNMGLAYLNNQKVADAFAAFQHALELDPEVFEHRGRVGTIIQPHAATDYGRFYFLLAKSFASTNNADRCAYYLRKARDEGYSGIDGVKSDPAFSGVLNDATVRTILGLPELPGAPPKGQGIG
jgi:tetratricopeptide (TPR) repeat protein